jgi:hypothetical protein
MKKIVFVFFTLYSIGLSFAQVGRDIEEAFDNTFGGIEWFRENISLDITHNSFIGETNGVQQKWNSIGYNFGIMLNKDLLYKNGSRFTIGYGVRFANNTFRNDGVLHIYDSLNIIKFDVYSSDSARSAYKISMRYFEVPLEFRWRYYGGRFDVLRFSFGCVLGFRSKFFDESKFGNITLARSNFGDANSFRFGLISRVGFRHIGLFAGYYFTPIFQNASSSKLNVLSIGLNFAI